MSKFNQFEQHYANVYIGSFMIRDKETKFMQQHFTWGLIITSQKYRNVLWLYYIILTVMNAIPYMLLLYTCKFKKSSEAKLYNNMHSLRKALKNLWKLCIRVFEKYYFQWSVTLYIMLYLEVAIFIQRIYTIMRFTLQNDPRREHSSYQKKREMPPSTCWKISVIETAF